MTQQRYGDWAPHDGGHPFDSHEAPAAFAALDERLAFIRRTYIHLCGAIVAFVLTLTALVNSPFAEPMIRTMLTGRAWLLVIGLFMVTGWVADWWAHNVKSTPMQYLGLALGVVSYAVVFLPMIYFAAFYSSPAVLPLAAITTLSAFCGLTGFVFVSKRDFSILRMGLAVMSFLALGAIVGGVLFGFNLGLGFSIIMVGLSAGYVVYYTSNVLHHYRTDQHVGASLALFSAIALMFWYILRIFLSKD